MLKCNECGKRVPTYQPQCPYCMAEKSLTKEPLAIPYGNLDSDFQNEKACYETGFSGLDVMLKGGLATGRGYFFYGRPGIGKTTLLLQILAVLQKGEGKIVLFSNEETKSTIGEKISQLGIDVSNIDFVFDKNLDEIAEYVRIERPVIAFLDSFQTVSSTYQSQVKVSKILRHLYTFYHCALVVIGHANKNGDYTGAREIEHDVDVVIEMEKGLNGEIIVKTPHKNRLAGTGKRFVCRMTSRGIIEKPAIETGFLLRHSEKEAIGIAAFCAAIAGDITVDEITVTLDKASTNPKLSLVGAAPKQAEFIASVIMSSNKAFMPCYILRANRSVKLSPASDLACVVAALSMHNKKPVPLDTVLMASIDASGKLLPVEGDMEQMTNRAIEQGYKRIIGPKAIGSQAPNWTEAESLTDVLNALNF